MSSAVVTDLTILRLLKPHGGDRCASDVLGLFKWFASKERPGYWFKARYVDIAKYLGNLYSKQAIARATKLLDNLGILLQHKHSEDRQIRTFYYEFRPDSLADLTETLKVDSETLEVDSETLEVDSETLEVDSETLSIYTDPHSLDPYFSDPLSLTPQQIHSADEEKVVEEEEEDERPDNQLLSELYTEIRALPVDIQLNQNTRNTVKTNWRQVKTALTQIKLAIRDWKVKPNFNWTGLFIKACKGGLDLEISKTEIIPQVNPPNESQLAQLEKLKQTREIQDYFFSATDNCIKVVLLGGRMQMPWWEVLS